MATAQTIKRVMPMTEFNERRQILKNLYGAANWLRSKCAGWNVDVEVTSYGDIYRAVMTVQWQPLPTLPEVMPTVSKVGGPTE